MISSAPEGSTHREGGGSTGLVTAVPGGQQPRSPSVLARSAGSTPTIMATGRGGRGSPDRVPGPQPSLVACRPVPGRIVFVTPRFGPAVVGGSEAVSREIAAGLAARGWEVEVLTTCAVDHYSWENELLAGDSREEGVLVRRFPCVQHRSRAGSRAQVAIQDGRVPSRDAQLSWMGWRFTVPGLFHHLLAHGGGYDAVVFSPYLFWTTTVCMPLVAERAVVVPCLHDEAYARLEVLRPVLASPAAVWFLSEPEHRLAHRLGPVAPRHRVTGSGVEVPEAYDPEGFRRRHGLRRPFVLYAGRRETDKGWGWLLRTFAEAVAAGGVQHDLLTVGVGEVEVPRGLQGRVVDLGFVSRAERDDALAAAAAYIQPSLMESFSRTVMEAWLAGTPVLYRHGSEVVAWHCERSGGGLSFADAPGLARLLRRLGERPGEAAEMAEAGRRYVLDSYRWPAVLDRIEASLEEMSGAGGGVAGDAG